MLWRQEAGNGRKWSRGGWGAWGIVRQRAGGLEEQDGVMIAWCWIGRIGWKGSVTRRTMMDSDGAGLAGSGCEADLLVWRRPGVSPGARVIGRKAD